MLTQELKRRTIHILLIVSLGALAAAYQVRPPMQIDVGRRDDGPHLIGFHDSEHADGISYRWSSGHSTLYFPSVASWTPVQLTMRLNGCRPNGLISPHVVVLANGREVGPLQATDQFETYRLHLAPDIVGIWGDVTIDIHCDEFVPAQVTGTSDQRKLGVLVDSASLEPIRGPASLVVPPLRQCLSLLLVVAATYLWARQLALSAERSLLAAGLCLLAVATLVIRWPMVLGLYDRWLVALVAAANVGTILFRAARSRLTGERGVPAEVVSDVHLLLISAVAIAAAPYAWQGLWQPLTEDRATDFFINYTAATVLAEGGDIYDPAALMEASRQWHQPDTTFEFGSLFVTYIAPPFHATMLLPLVPLGYETARLVFLALSNLLLFSSLALILRASDRDFHRPPWLLLAFLIVFVFHPIYTSLALGQVDFVILFLISLSYWAYLTDRKLLVGPALAVAAMIKLSPAVLLLYFLWKRQFGIVVSAAITGVVCVIISLVAAGPREMLQFATDILPALLKGTAFYQNQSFNGFYGRLLVDPTLYYSLQEFPSLPAVQVLTLLSSLALIGVVAYFTRPRWGLSSLHFPYESALVVGTLILVSSISWDHYIVWLLPGFVALLHPHSSLHLSKARYWTVMGLSWCAFLLVIVPTSWYGMTLHDCSGTHALEPGLCLLVSTKFYGVLLFCSSLALLLAGLDSSQRHGSVAGLEAEGHRVPP
jgi:alpha-1,2-mannosyltransferase